MGNAVLKIGVARYTDSLGRLKVFVPELVAVYQNGLHQLRDDGSVPEDAKLRLEEAIEQATFPLDTSDTLEIVSKLKSCYEALYKQGVVFPPSIGGDWIETYVSKESSGISNLKAKEIVVKIQGYKPSASEKWLPKLGLVLGLLVTVGAAAAATLEVAVLAGLGALGVLPVLFMFGFGLYWYNSGDFVDKMNAIARDVDRWWKGQYKETIGQFSLWRTAMSFFVAIITGGVSISLGAGAYLGTFNALKDAAPHFPKWAAWFARPTVLLGIAAFTGIAIVVGTAITLGYSLSNYFGWGIREPKFVLNGDGGRGHNMGGSEHHEHDGDTSQLWMKKNSQTYRPTAHNMMQPSQGYRDATAMSAPHNASMGGSGGFQQYAASQHRDDAHSSMSSSSFKRRMWMGSSNGSDSN